MTDTEILDAVLVSLKYYAHEGTPASPKLLGEEADWIESKRNQRREKSGAPALRADHFYEPLDREELDKTLSDIWGRAQQPQRPPRKQPELIPIGAGTVTNGCDPQQADHSYNSLRVDPGKYAAAVLNDSATCVKCGQPSFSIPRLGISHRCSWKGEKGDIGHSPPRWCDQHDCVCMDTETSLHKFYAKSIPYQHFWRCEHHPFVLENLNEVCEYGCHVVALRWFDNGFHQEPVDPT